MIRHIRHANGNRAPLMARETAHAGLTPERCLVDVVDHLDHLPRDRLLRLDVEFTFVGVRVVAIAAAYAERRFEQDHRRIEHVRPLAFERLDVLEDLLGLLIAALGYDRPLAEPCSKDESRDRRRNCY
jgi:hypothetical protein